MATPVLMPQMGESITEGTIVRWIKKVGDVVDRDDRRPPTRDHEPLRHVVDEEGRGLGRMVGDRVGWSVHGGHRGASFGFGSARGRCRTGRGRGGGRGRMGAGHEKSRGAIRPRLGARVGGGDAASA